MTSCVLNAACVDPAILIPTAPRIDVLSTYESARGDAQESKRGTGLSAGRDVDRDRFSWRGSTAPGHSLARPSDSHSEGPICPDTVQARDRDEFASAA